VNAAGARSTKVSVILPVYNGARFVREAIDSVLAQSFGVYEVMVVNDGSRDESEDVIRPCLSRPNFKYLAQANQGVPAGCNAGIRLADGELITLIDQDDLWPPDKLELQVRYMDAHPEVGLRHTRVDFIDADSRAMEQMWPGWVRDCAGWRTDKQLAGNPIAPLKAMFRRACRDDGLFDPAWDACWRLGSMVADLPSGQVGRSARGHESVSIPRCEGEQEHPDDETDGDLGRRGCFASRRSGHHPAGTGVLPWRSCGSLVTGLCVPRPWTF